MDKGRGKKIAQAHSMSKCVLIVFRQISRPIFLVNLCGAHIFNEVSIVKLRNEVPLNLMRCPYFQG